MDKLYVETKQSVSRLANHLKIIDFMRLVGLAYTDNS